MQTRTKPKFIGSTGFWVLIALLAVVIACVPLAFAKPSLQTLEQHISPELIETAKSTNQYSLSSENYVIFNLIRGKNVNIKTGTSETYLGFCGHVFSMNSGFGKGMGDILFWLPSLLIGTQVTMLLTVLSVIAGLLSSVFLALGRISKKKFLNRLCGAYIFFFRGTPLLLQLYFIYYALPQISPLLAINNKFLAAFLAFALNSAAYCAEIIRAAIQSIDKGQHEASRALGLRYGQTMRLIIIPQSIRRLIPPVANEFIMVLKDASLVSLIALSDLTHVTRSINSSNRSVLVFIPTMVIYLVLTAVFTYIFNRAEKRFSVYH